MSDETRIYFAQGVGHHKWDKNARDDASEPCGLADLNLVNVSSVIPPHRRIIDQDEFRDRAPSAPDRILHAIHGICQSNVVGQIVSATLTAVIPDDDDLEGYVAEVYEWPGLNAATAIKRCEFSALELFANRHGQPGLDANAIWQPGRDRYTFAGLPCTVRTLHAEGEVNWQGDYCVALVACVFVP
jgi:arginine decarboxylase